MIDQFTEETANDKLVAAAKAWEDKYYTRVKQHINDIRFISEALLQEATDRGWCDDFDEFVDNLNKDLTVELTGRRKDYTVRVSFTIDCEVNIEAKSEDEAREQARDLIAQELDRTDYIEEYDDNDNWDIES